MKRLIGIVITLLLVFVGLGGIVQASDDNAVMVNSFTYYVHSATSDTVGNDLLTTAYEGTVSGIDNWNDGSGESISDPVLQFQPGAGVTVESLSRQDLYSEPPDTSYYEWHIPSVDDGNEDSRSVETAAVLASFEPGYIVTRTFSDPDDPADENPTEFTTAIDNLALDIEVTPDVDMNQLQIMVGIPYDPLVKASITSASGDGDINVSADMVNISIPEPDYNGETPTTYENHIEIQVQLNGGVTNIEFKPMMYVIAWYNTGSSETPTVTYTVERAMELGTWTWLTGTNYSWHWSDRLAKVVLFPEIARNQIGVNFETVYHYDTDGNHMNNDEMTQSAWIGSNLHNQGDNTNEDIIGPSPLGGPTLNLNTGETVTDFQHDYWNPGSYYDWYFPIMSQHNGYDGGAQIEHEATYYPGFSVERSVNDDIFPSTGGSQVLNIEVEVLEEGMERLEIHGKTWVDDFNVATIDSVVGPNMNYGDYGFDAWIDSPELGTYNWQVNIVIGSYGSTEFQFMPFVTARLVDIVDSGVDWGDNHAEEVVSLGATPISLGTLSWQATGDYAWSWEKRVTRAANLNGYAGAMCNAVRVNAGTTYSYRTACNSVGNIDVRQNLNIGSSLLNEWDITADNIIGPDPPNEQGGPILNLNTTETVTNWRSENYVNESEYDWYFPVIEPGQRYMGNADLDLNYEEPIQTGFTVTRNAAPTSFPATGGNRIQTFDLTVYPQAEMEVLRIGGNTRVDDFDGATIVAVSGENINYEAGGYSFDIHMENVDPAEVPEEGYEWQIIIEIADPLPPEFLALEYMPNIWVMNTHVIDSGTHNDPEVTLESRDVSNDLLGTWRWEAEGDYCWTWSQTVSKRVDMEGYAVHTYADAPTQEIINQAIDNGLTWIRSQQHEDGSWYWGRPPRSPDDPGSPDAPNVGMTSFAIWSMLHGQIPPSDPQVQAGIDFILSQQRIDPENIKEYGAIYSDQPVYETSLAILALRATNDNDYLDEIELAVDFLIRAQNDESVEYPEGVSLGEPPTDNWAYGGWGYRYGAWSDTINIGDTKMTVDPYVWSDLSNTSFAMLALKAAQQAGIIIPSEVWTEAVEHFVTNCQNTDGGFGYQPKDGSSGTLTAGGLWCLWAGDISVSDPRVGAGLQWLECHNFYDRNPSGGPYHYWFLWSAAKAFTVYGLDPELVVDTWYYDYAGYIVANQEPDGHWSNPEWPEGESELNGTACALLVLEKVVLPPPPGLNKIHIDIDSMRVEFSPDPKEDNIKIFEARYWLDEGYSFDLAEDDVRVVVDGVVTTIPAGSFTEKKGRYQFVSTGAVTPKINMEIAPIDATEGTWRFILTQTDASSVNKCGGVHVTLIIGDMFTGKLVPMWIDYIVYPPIG